MEATSGQLNLKGTDTQWRMEGRIVLCTRVSEQRRGSAAAVQVPIGVEDQLEGVVDLVRWKAIYNKGTKG
jgi:hypothetical protein